MVRFEKQKRRTLVFFWVIPTILLIETRNPKEAVMPEPNVAHKFPAEVKLEAGKNYAWCACGYSQKQPFCDGSHKAHPPFVPLGFKATETKTVFLCQCKHSNNKPYCDNTHKTLA